MSIPLEGFPDCVFYNYYLIGGPNDGEVSNGFRPYFRLTIEGAIYEVLNPDAPQDEYVEWVDDGTRKIKLYYKGEQDD